jgi:hypothetical protein
MNPKDLLANPKNWRKHPKNQVDAMGGVLDEIGWIQEVIWNKRTARLIDGHLRVELAKRAGESTVPVKVVDLSEEEENIAILTFDPLGAMAEADKIQLNNLLTQTALNNETVDQLIRDLQETSAKMELKELKENPNEEDQQSDILNTRLNILYCEDNNTPMIIKQDIPEFDKISNFKYRGSSGVFECLHFFTDDYRFECVWNRPEYYLNAIKGKVVMSPDFSVYTDYNFYLQQWNFYRNRFIGSYYQENGLTVIPTITWADDSSFDWCFGGVEIGSTVAISTMGSSKFSEEFSHGFDAMIDVLEPEKIICCGIIEKVYNGDSSLSNVVNYKHDFKSHAYLR